MRFSIIVPVYNVSKYLTGCLNSVLEQKNKDFQIILIDDGSTDESGILCDQYEKKYEFIKTIHKKNGGLSSARNAGLKVATGEYIIFLDADDFWLDWNMLEEIDAVIEKEKVDIVAFGGKEYHEYDKEQPYKDLKVSFDKKVVSTSEDFLTKSMRENELFPWYAWIYAIKREVIEKKQFCFPEGRYYEDVYAVWRLVMSAASVCTIPKEYYAYRIGRENAITASVSYVKLRDFLWANETNIKDVLQNDNISEELKTLLLDSFSKNYYSCCILQGKLEGHERKKYYKELKERKYLMNYAIGKKWVAIRNISKVIGFRLMLFIFHVRADWREKNV